METKEACNCFVCVAGGEKSKLLQREDEMKTAKVIVQRDPRRAHGWEFMFRNETPTLGNLLRCALIQHPQVDHAAHRMEHPSIPNLFVFLRPKETTHDPCQILLETLDTEIAKIEAYRHAMTETLE